jgi:DNA primase
VAGWGGARTGTPEALVASTREVRVGIVDEDIARVRETADIVAVVSEHVQLKRVGRRWSGLCPFHGEKSPSFSVNQDQGLYYCFGCGAKGDVITFVREIDHLDFVGAVEKLASTAGIALRYTDTREGDSRKQRSRLVEAMAAAVEFYHERLLSGPDAAPARAYLRGRGFSSDEVRHYQLGWAPDSWDTLVKTLKVPRAVLVESGLAFENKRGSLTDAFRGRIMFPIFNPNGDPVAFGGRIMPGAEGPKYKNSSSSPVYDKSRVLYGLNWAKGPMVAGDEAIVCEGYTDVIGFASVGLDRAVATCGTALTEDHVRVLRGYASRVVLAFDADAAGQKAAERFHEWEQRHGLDVAVAAMPAGSDPGDLARSDPDALRQAVEQAVPFLRFRVDRVLAAADTSTAESRARVATAALAVIGGHPDPLVRDQYLMDLGDRLRLPTDQLRERLARGPVVTGARTGRSGDGDRRSGGSPPTAERRPVAPAKRRDSPEYEALRLALVRADEIAPSLHGALFADPLAYELYCRLSAVGWRAADLTDVPEEVEALALRLAVEMPVAEPAEVVDRLVEAAGLRELALLGAEARQAGDDERALEVAGVISWLKPQLEALRDPKTAPEAAPGVLGWLVERHEGRG